MKKILLDTNVLIDWLNSGRHESVMTDPGYARFLSAVVVMELRAGANTRASRDAVNAITRAYGTSGRLFPPSTDAFDRAGSVLRKLKLAGRNVRDSAFCNDVLIAMSARTMGATVITANLRDFTAIHQVEPFNFEPPWE